MPDLVPIRIKILKNPDGSMNYPDFRHTLQIFVDIPDYKSGQLHYDKTDCKTVTPNSPAGQRWGLKLVDKRFAQEAIAEFPTRVTVLTEPEAKTFWDEKVYAHIDANRVNSVVIQDLTNQVILAKEAGLTTELAALTARAAKAIDPNDPEPGVQTNPLKTFDGMKSAQGVKIIGV